jgi:hypothetical protein
MMRKVLYLATLLGCMATTSKAQFPIQFRTAAQDGIPLAMSPGNTVFVNRINPPVPWNNQNFCGVGNSTPNYGGYVAGATKSDGFKFTFSTGATRIRIQMADIADNDTVQILINNSPYNLVGGPGGNVSASAVCPAINTVVVANGMITSQGSPVNPTACQIDISTFPTLINNFSVYHRRTSPNIFANGVIFHTEYWEDTCDVTLLKVTSNDPCTGKDLILTATNYTNANFAWSDGASWTANTTTGTVTRPNINILAQNKTYTVTVTKPGCPPMSASTYVAEKTGPAKPTISLNTSPVCKGGTVDLDGYTTGIVGVNYFWYGPAGYTSNTQQAQIVGIQTFQGGYYSLYAISTDGCVSDTTDTLVTVLQPAEPKFLPTVLYGCTFDTIIFNNTSTGDTALEWYVNKVLPSGPIVNLISIERGTPTVTYIMPVDKHEVDGAHQK